MFFQMISNMGDEIRSTYIQIEGSTVLTVDEKEIVESNAIKCKQRIHIDSEENFDKDDDDKNGERYDSDEFYFDDNGGEGYDVGDDFEDSESTGDVDKADSDRDGMNNEDKIKEEVDGQEVKTETNDASNTFDDVYDSWKHLLTEEEYEAQRYRYNYRYNLRRRSSSTYMHLEVADDDNFLCKYECASTWDFKVGKMSANKHICHASGIYREILAIRAATFTRVKGTLSCFCNKHLRT